MPVQRWANFIAGFSVEFVLSCLHDVKAGGLVLDPFLGCATTVVGARCRGLDSAGYEAHPLFSILAQAKADKYEPGDLDRVAAALGRRRKRHLSDSASTFLEKLFDEQNLARLLQASSAVDDLPPRLRPLGVALFLKVAEAACGAQTDGIYKAPTSRKKNVPFATAFESAVALFRHDIDSPWYRRWSTAATARVFAASSLEMREVQSGSASAVVTSPPYLNNFDFAEMTRMQLYLLGMASSWGDITAKVRSRLITNTTTALQGRKDQSYQQECRSSLAGALREQLDGLVADLREQRRVRAGKKEYDFLVYPYYAQINQVLHECMRALRPGGRIHWVVSDAALYGSYIATHEHTAFLMREAGFGRVSIETLRRRGHRWKLAKRDGAPGRLGEYHVVGTKP